MKYSTTALLVASLFTSSLATLGADGGDFIGTLSAVGMYAGTELLAELTSFTAWPMVDGFILGIQQDNTLVSSECYVSYGAFKTNILGMNTFVASLATSGN